MLKKLAALALSGVIAVTSLTPTMAQANGHSRNNISQDELIGGLIFGAIALYALSEASKDKKKKKKERRVETKPAPTPKPKHTQNGHTYNRDVHHRPNRKVLPTHCIRHTSGGQGPARFFGRKCLRENYRHYNELPRTCFGEFQTHRGWRVGFGPRCLRRNGYAW